MTVYSTLRLLCAHIFLFNPHNNSMRYIWLFCPGCGGLEKVNNWEVSYNLYLFDSKASNSLFFFWYQDCFTFWKIIKGSQKILLLISTDIYCTENSSCEKFKSSKYTSKHFISHLGDVITLFSLWKTPLYTQKWIKETNNIIGQCENNFNLVNSLKKFWRSVKFPKSSSKSCCCKPSYSTFCATMTYMSNIMVKWHKYFLQIRQRFTVLKCFISIVRNSYPSSLLNMRISLFFLFSWLLQMKGSIIVIIYDS